MDMVMTKAAAVLFLFAAVTLASADTCIEYLPVHKIFAEPDNSYKFSDDREIKGNVYNVGGCKPYPNYRTAAQYSGNYTLMGHEADVSSNECLIKKNKRGDSVYNSMQAVVIRSNGWKFDANSIDLDDIDSQTNLDISNAWKESMALFAMSDGHMVVPTIKFQENTLLSSKQYIVTASAMKEMGFEETSVRVPGGEYGADFVHNCAFGREDPDSGRCRMTASFTEGIDTLVILYALSQKSVNDPNAAVFFSEMMLRCGCRCSVKDGSAAALVPVPGTENECYETVMTRPRVKCDLLGNKMCTYEESLSWQATSSSKLSNGNVPCAQKPSDVTRISSEFKPTENFASLYP